jgi:uncharacterized protein (TIGR00730 family)
MSKPIKAVAVYCGSRDGHDPKWVALAKACGQAMVKRDLALVFGGGRYGLMGAIARAVIDAKGTSTGVIPESLLSAEPAMEELTELFIVDSMHTRKALMAERADAFLVLPGGVGTFEEFFEVWTWHQLGFHNKPIVLLNAFDYYTPLLDFLDRTHQFGFLLQAHHGHLRVATDVESALDLIETPCAEPNTNRRAVRPTL